MRDWVVPHPSPGRAAKGQNDGKDLGVLLLIAAAGSLLTAVNAGASFISGDRINWASILVSGGMLVGYRLPFCCPSHPGGTSAKEDCFDGANRLGRRSSRSQNPSMRRASSLRPLPTRSKTIAVQVGRAGSPSPWASPATRAHCLAYWQSQPRSMTPEQHRHMLYPGSAATLVE